MMQSSRPRRNRRSEALRSLYRETSLSPSDFVWPLFVIDGKQSQEEIESMPGVSRKSSDLLLDDIASATELGIRAVALFPSFSEELKDPTAKESLNKQNFYLESIRQVKERFPDLVVISDVAMDPYSSDGHDGLLKDGVILNDETLEILAGMALCQAQAGVDIIAPSDMMDGRVGHIRSKLDQEGFQEVSILSYTAKYCSCFYGPFREALDSAPKSGDKKTYQMDPANRKEALRELKLDTEEGADALMVKPALSYLDVIADFKKHSELPIAAYQVSGEYSMIMKAAQAGVFDEKSAFLETLTSIKRAGADLIFSYWSKTFCEAFARGETSPKV